jgi:hypothetical protein
MVYLLLKMVMFDSYVKLPEDMSNGKQEVNVVNLVPLQLVASLVGHAILENGDSEGAFSSRLPERLLVDDYFFSGGSTHSNH